MAQAYKIASGPEERLITALADAVRAGNFEPPQLPHIAMEILKLTQDPDVSMRQIGRLMAKDQVLTAKVLHLANSALYPGGGGISSPARAMAHIGLDGLKQMLFAFAFKGAVFRSKCFQAQMQDIWFHSVACAVASDLVGRTRGTALNEAFVGGLMHDIGKPVALNTFIRLSHRDRSLECDTETVMDLVERVHAQLGGLIASRWGLPDSLKSVISNHHRSEAVTGANAELVRVVAAGNAICRAAYLGYPRPAGARNTEPAGIVELHRVGIDTDQANALCHQVEEKTFKLRSSM